MRAYRAANGGDYPRRKEMRTERRSSGLCWQCGKEQPAFRGKCLACLDRCSRCSSPRLPDRRFCAEHLGTEREKKRKASGTRFSVGICASCTDARMAHTSFCEKHYLRNCANTNLRNPLAWEALGKLFAQCGGRCAYCGDALTLGLNAHLDHVKSRKRFPELARDVNNVVWACRDCNYAKRDRTPPEFIAMCKRVVAYSATQI